MRTNPALPFAAPGTVGVRSTPHGVSAPGFPRSVSAIGHGERRFLRCLAEEGKVEDVVGVERLVQKWLGPLIQYDARRGSELVETLSHYLECGGNYDATATALSMHRNTLKYRLQRIRELSRLDLADADTRFNLQLATRAWHTLIAMRADDS